MTFQLYRGTTCTLLPLKEFSSIMGNAQDLYLKRTSATLKMYNGSTMSPLGKSTLRHTTKGEVSKSVDFFIVDDDVRPLLGAETCQELNFIKVMVNDIPTVNSVNVQCQPNHSALTEERILNEYSDVFKGLGCMEGLCQLEVNQTI